MIKIEQICGQSHFVTENPAWNYRQRITARKDSTKALLITYHGTVTYDEYNACRIMDKPNVSQDWPIGNIMIM